MQKFKEFLQFVRKNLAFLIPLMLAAGLTKGHWYPMAYSRAICISALLVMIFPVFINLEFEKGLKEFRQGMKPLAIATVLNFVVYPLAAGLLGWLFLRTHPAMRLGLILLSLVPTSGMTINWTYFTKGKMPVAMAIVSTGIVLAVILMPFEVPLLTKWLMKESAIKVNPEVIIEKLFFVIILPLFFGWGVRTWILRKKGREFFNSIKPVNGGISALGVLLVSFLVMSLRSCQEMFQNMPVLLLGLVPVVLFYAFMFLVSHFVGRLFLPPDEAKPLFFGTAARYHVITLGVVLGAFRQADYMGYILIMVALGLAVQIPALAFYARRLNKMEKAVARWICRHCQTVCELAEKPEVCPSCGQDGAWASKAT